MIPSRPQSLHRRLLRSETCGVAFYAICFGFAIPPFAIRVNARQKAIAKSFDRLPDARNFRDIDASPNNHIFKWSRLQRAVAAINRRSRARARYRGLSGLFSGSATI